MEEKKKRMVAFEVPEAVYNELKELEASLGGIGISGIIRMIISDYLHRYVEKGKEQNE